MLLFCIMSKCTNLFNLVMNLFGILIVVPWVFTGMEEFVLSVVHPVHMEENKSENIFILSPSLLQKTNIQVNIT